MKHAFFSVAIILASLFGADLYAQDVEMTPYEQKREQLGMQAMEKLMNTMSAYDRTLFSVGLMNALKEAHEAGDRYQEMIIGENIIYAFCDIGEGLQTEANLLTKSIDISDVYAGEAIQEWKEIGQWYKQERIKLDQTKTAEDIKREQERAESMRTLSGVPGVKQRVKKEYLKWAKKGELEKTSDYNNRLSLKSAAVFDSLCFIHFNQMFNSSVLMRTTSDYDADKEGVDVEFYQVNKDGVETSRVASFWPISISQAKRISNSDKWNIDRQYAKGLFFKDGDCYPATWHLSLGPNEWDFVLGTPETYSLSMTEVLGEDNSLKNDHQFDYSRYSLNLIPYEVVRSQINAILEETKGPYETVMSYSHEKYLPYVSRFYTSEQVEQILKPLKTKAANIQKGRQIIADFTTVFKREYGCYVFNSHFGSEDNSNLERVGAMDNVQLTAFIAQYVLGDTRILESIGSSLYPEQKTFLQNLNKVAVKYNLNMDSTYQELISRSPSLLRRYKKLTPEESIKRFKEEVGIVD